MVTQDDYGLWISVPDGNGYDKDSFRDRVLPHLQQIGVNVSMPIISQLKDITLVDNKKVENIVEPDERHFGIMLSTSGNWWSDVYRKLDNAESILKKHYGLEFDSVSVEYQPDHYSVMFTREPKDPSQGVEGNSSSRK
jgi:hypothetical protein